MMDSLKSAIADKVLEISSSGRSDMREKLDKINRFRDFVNACQALIEKYPAVESELRRMVELGDFDTKTASIRVDTIIRLSENSPSGNMSYNNEIERDRSRLGQITSRISGYEEGNLSEESYEDIGYKEMNRPGQKQFIDFDDIADYTGEKPSETGTSDVDVETNKQNEYLPYRDLIIENNTVKPQANPTKDTAKKGIQVVVAIVAIVILIFAIVFVIRNFETVLWGLGIVIILAFIVWIIVFNKKNKDQDDEETEADENEEE